MHTRMDDGTPIIYCHGQERQIILHFGTLTSDEWSISVGISNDSRYPWINAKASASVDMCLMDS